MTWRRANGSLVRLWLGVGAAALAAGCAPVGARVEQEPAAPDRVRRGAFVATHVVTGELRAVRADAIVVPRIPSWQMPIQWLEQDGARVEEGRPVLELDNSVFSGDLEQRRLNAARMVNELVRKEAEIAVRLEDKEFAVEQARTEVEKARIEADIPERLRARREHQEKQLAFEQAEFRLAKAVEDLDADRRAADAELEEKRIAVAKAENDVRVAEQSIEALVVRAPRSGILVVDENRREGRKYQVGDQVNIGRQVASIPDLAEMLVEADLYDVDDRRIAPGMRARCVIDTYPESEFGGTVESITPVAEEVDWRSTRRAFQVVVRLDTADPARMRPGMSVRVEVRLPGLEDVLLVPRTALALEGDAIQAVLADGARVSLEVGPCNATECVVEGGLEEGQRLGRPS